MDIKHRTTFSPKQLSRAIGVSEASVKRWCDKGRLAFDKTIGGHRRLALHAILGFIHENNLELVNPEVLNLPVTGGSSSGTHASEQSVQGST